MPPLTVGKLNSPLVELYDKFDSPDARLIALLAKVFEKYLLDPSEMSSVSIVDNADAITLPELLIIIQDMLLVELL